MGAISTLVGDALNNSEKNGCKTCSILAELDAEDREVIIDVIKKKKLSNDKVANILTKANYSISPTSIKRHFDRGCSPTIKDQE